MFSDLKELFMTFSDLPIICTKTPLKPAKEQNRLVLIVKNVACV